MKKQLLFLLSVLLLAGYVSAQWSDDAGTNLQITDMGGEQTIPKIALAGNGDYFVGYFSVVTGNLYHVYLQRLNNDGYPQWADNGILVSDHPSMTWLTDWDMAADDDGYAILAFQDIRTGNNNVFAYRISPDGDFVWGEDGIQLSTGDSFDVAPVVTVTAEGNAVIVWQSEGDIIMQKISPDGTKQWGEWGITLSGANNYSWPQLLPVGDDDVIMKFYEDSGLPWAPTRHILAQRFDGDGSPVWDDPAVVYDLGLMTAHTQIIAFENDGADGFYMAWHEYSMSGTAATARLQHVNAIGESQFEANGVILSDAHQNNQFYPKIAAPANDPNIYVFWAEVTGDQNWSGITGQKVAPDGSLLWGQQGNEFIPFSSQSHLPQAALPLHDDMVFVYQVSQAGGAYTVKAFRLNQDGDMVWSPAEVYISSVASSKTHMHGAAFDGKQWTFAWGGNRTGNPEIYAQNLLTNGSMGIADMEEFTLTLVIEGEGAVFVDGNAYTEPVIVEEGTVLTLLAEAHDNWQFDGWSGDLVSDNPEETILMDGDKQITATFTEIPPEMFTLNLFAEPEEGGSVSGAGEYEAGADVSIEAILNSGYVFMHWLDDDEEVFSEAASTTFQMPAGDLNLTAIFDLENFIMETDAGEVKIFPNPAGNHANIVSDSPMHHIQIIDMTGKTHLSVDVSEGKKAQINTGSLPVGMYLVRIHTQHHTITKTLNIQH